MSLLAFVRDVSLGQTPSCSLHAPFQGLHVKTSALHFPRSALLAALFTALLATSLLSACGGGDDPAPAATGVTSAPVSPAPVSPVSPAPVSPAPVTPAAFTLTGTAATGAAIAGGSVTANCTMGTASGSTAIDGSFTLTLDKGQVAPCLLRVTKAAAPPAAAVELYGFAAAAGRVNITTLTDTALTRALAASPADVFATFDAARAAAINSALPAAISYVQAQFTASNLGTAPANLMTASFTIGDAYDKLLDNMTVAFLGAGKTYADFIAVVKKAGDLITVTTPTSIAASDITVPASILALPYTGKPVYLRTAADSAGFAGSHFFGRGWRTGVQTLTDLYPAYTEVSGCKLSVEGSEFVFTNNKQTTRVAFTPYLLATYQGVDYYSASATVNPTNANGTVRFVSFVGTPNAAGKSDGITVFISNGVVSDVSVNDYTTSAVGTSTTCGGGTGGNLNTDRSTDTLSLPTDWVATAKAAAIAKGSIGSVDKPVTATDLTGLAVSVNFGRGVYTTYNADLTVKEVTRVSDCKTEVKDGKLRLSSVQAAYDHSFTFTLGTYLHSPNADSLLFLGRETTDVTSASSQFSIDLRTGSPFVKSVNGVDFVGTKQSLNCPVG